MLMRTRAAIVGAVLVTASGVVALIEAEVARRHPTMHGSVRHAAEAIAGGRYGDWARSRPAEVSCFRRAIGLTLDEEYGAVAISNAIADPPDCRTRHRARQFAREITTLAESVGTPDSDAASAIRATAARALRELRGRSPGAPRKRLTDSVPWAGNPGN